MDHLLISLARFRRTALVCQRMPSKQVVPNGFPPENLMHNVVLTCVWVGENSNEQCEEIVEGHQAGAVWVFFAPTSGAGPGPIPSECRERIVHACPFIKR